MKRRSARLVFARRAAWVLPLTFAACTLFAPDRSDLTGGDELTSGSSGATSGGASSGRGGLDAAAGSGAVGAGGELGTSSGSSGSSGSTASGGASGTGASSGTGGTLGTGGGAGGTNGAGGTSGTGGMSGGAGTAGSVGRGGSAGTAGTGGIAGGAGAAGAGGIDAGVPPGTECTNNASLQCRLHGDCCTCTGLTTFEPDPPPTCAASCSMNECQRTGITGPQCLLGQCIAGVDCTTLLVTCPDPRPVCPTGTVVSRVGGCWGPCVNPTDCGKVENCTACRPGQLCVAYAEAGTFARYRCLNVPSRCSANPRCNCLRSYACPNSYTSCVDTSTGVTCNCPNC